VDSKHPEVEVMNIDKLSYASNLIFLKQVRGYPNHHLETVDICDRRKIRELIRFFEPDGIIHLAAESHVDNSILDPEPFVFRNVVGTFNLLEECRQYWHEVACWSSLPPCFD
jgi:dTDP-glucose 4,6-dehydratase